MRRTLLLTAGALSAGLLSAQTRVTDWVTTERDVLSGTPRQMVTIPGPAPRTQTLFVATDAFGAELWRTESTPSSTRRVKDIAFGARGSLPNQLTRVGSEVFFFAYSHGFGRELWRSDGTAVGTVMVKDIETGPSSTQSPQDLIEFGGKLYFTIRTASNGRRQIWTSDGTSAGTVPITPLTQFADHLAIFQNRLWFTSSGRSFYSTDGTSAGTRMEFNATGNGINSLTPAGNRLFFLASTPTEGQELWSTDGTTESLTREIQPGRSGSIQHITPIASGEVVFVADDGMTGKEPYRSDGTAAGTIRLANIGMGSTDARINGFVAFPGGAIFNATGPTTGNEPWVTDGTSAGTRLLLDLAPGVANSSPIAFTCIGNEVWFSARANTTPTSPDVWITDGTAAGTRGIDTGSGNARISVPRAADFTEVFTNRVVFSEVGPDGRELFRADRTTLTSQQVKDLFPAGAEGHANPRELQRLPRNRQTLLFATDSTAAGPEIAIADPTGASILDALPGPAQSFPKGLLRTQRAPENLVYYSARQPTPPYGTKVMRASKAGVSVAFDLQNPDQLTWVNTETLAGIANFTAAGREPFLANTRTGAVDVRDVRSGTQSSVPTLLTAAGNRLYLVANDGMGKEPVRINLGPPGSITKFDVMPGTQGSDPLELTTFGGAVYCSLQSPTAGRELHRLDDAGVQLVTDLVPGIGNSSPRFLSATDSHLFFVAAPTNDLMVYDGASAPASIADIVPGTSGAIYRNAVTTCDRLYFLVDDRVHGLELWTSDGTPAGTKLVQDLNPGYGDGALQNTLVVLEGSGTVVLGGSDGTNGLQLYGSNGDSVYQIGRIGSEAGSGAASLGDARQILDRLYFACDDGITGQELWVYDYSGTGFASSAAYGTGKRSGSLRLPPVACVSPPLRLGKTSKIQLFGGVPSGISAFIAGTNLAAIDIFGAELAMGTIALTLPVAAGPSGRFSVDVAVDTDPANIGVELLFQFWPVSGTSLLQSTNGVATVIGR